MSVLTPGSPTFLEDAALIAESIVVQPADQKDAHWDDSAKNFIEGIIIHVATWEKYEGKRHLPMVREVIKKALWVADKSDKKPTRFCTKK